MPYQIDDTHDPNLESWVESANDPDTDFPIQNLPFCWYWRPDNDGLEPPSSTATVGVRIGNMLLDLVETGDRGLIVDRDGDNPSEYQIEYWLQRVNETDLSSIRLQLQAHLLVGADRRAEVEKTLTPVREIDPVLQSLHLNEMRDYTDFYASLFHATNVGSMFRPDNPLLPNYKHMPIGYHGRASSIVASGTEIRRPSGQLLPGATIDDGDPTFGPCKLLDYELEVGAIIGRGNSLGEPVSIEEAEDHIFGLCLLNDWSARDMQKWEYQPLGPFLAKSFASTVSPYIVTMEALAPFRTPAQHRDPNDPTPLPYLMSDHDQALGGIDITLEVFLSSAQMRERGLSPIQLSKGNFKDMYWTISQMVAHHTSNGCNLNPGDLLGSGTVSGPMRDARGCLLELTWDGDPFANPPKVVPGTQRTPIELPTGETRKFLADGDEVIIKGYCEREGFRRIGFGECRGIITPAK